VMQTTNGEGRDCRVGWSAGEGLWWRVGVKLKPDHGGNVDIFFVNFVLFFLLKVGPR